jgi:hypothetical protein
MEAIKSYLNKSVNAHFTVIRSPEPVTSHTYLPTSHLGVESESGVPLPYEGGQPAVGIDAEWSTL